MSAATARRLDRRVYLHSRPVLFALLSATRRRPVLRLGRTVLVHDPEAYREVLTRVPLDRTAEGTTGGAAAGLTDGGLLFDQDGEAHRAGRRALAERLGSQGVERLRPVWQQVLADRLDPLAGPLDLVPVVRELAGATAAALTGSGAPPAVLAGAASAAAAAAAADHLPGLLPRRRAAADAARAAARLSALLPDPLDAMVAVAAVNTTVAALPRAAAWCARAGLWPQVSPELASELLRLTAPSPVLPRVAAADATVAGRPLHRGDRLVLVARHAAEAHRAAPGRPATAAQAVFGAGPHACPGARLARVQLTDFLTVLAPHRPVVLRARVDRRSALPGYAALLVGPGGAR
ncbi:cytochrome P450 [Kitasatospora sp. NPDC088346]|uniref:cytochrome P450 n=1 Tax=Kitasatospora sp. NPDC088346 TaxID=3364073 RepID=UPI0037FD91A3